MMRTTWGGVVVTLSDLISERAPPEVPAKPPEYLHGCRRASWPFRDLELSIHRDVETAVRLQGATVCTRGCSSARSTVSATI